MIKDSGERREFETGAVRDITEDKGRCDLLPLDAIADLVSVEYETILMQIEDFKRLGDTHHLKQALLKFSTIAFNTEDNTGKSIANMILEVAKHYQEGAKKYAERNWEKGIPTHCYIDSGTRHLLKYIRGDKDERHDRAFVWNLLGCIWTCNHMPEINDYPIERESKNENE